MSFKRNDFRKAVAMHRVEKSMGLRAAAIDSGISASTLCRIEMGKPPEMDTFTILCKWIGKKPSAFFL